MEYFDSDLHHNYNILISSLGEKINIKTTFFSEFKKSELKKRLIQKIDFDLFRSYGNFVNKRIRNGLTPFPELNGVLNIKDFTIDFNNDKFKISIKLFIKCSFFFIYNYIILIFQILKIFFIKKVNIDSKNILLENLFNVSSQISLKDSLDTISQSKLDILKEDLLVRGNLGFKVPNDESIVFDKHPFIFLLKNKAFSSKNLFFLFFEVFIFPLKFFYKCITNPLLVLLYKDFLIFPVVRFVNKRGKIKSIIFTTSQIHQQELWSRDFEGRKFESHFLNYSNNSNQFIYKKSKYKTHYPWLKHIVVDNHWVWTEVQKKYYKFLGHLGKSRVVDPILVNFPRILTNKHSNDLYIAIFDIPSFRFSFIKKHGIINFYYSLQNNSKFYNDIINVVDELQLYFGLNIKILLKPKRGSQKIYYSKGLKYISELSKSNNNFETVSHDTNIYSLISNSLCSISIPYTGTASVSSFLNKPSIYYDASNMLAKPDLCDENIEYIYSKELLKQSLKKIISNKINN